MSRSSGLENSGDAGCAPGVAVLVATSVSMAAASPSQTLAGGPAGAASATTHEADDEDRDEGETDAAADDVCALCGTPIHCGCIRRP
jgi:hypothetical protein